MRLLNYPIDLLPHMAPWEVKHYKDRCCTGSGRDYLRWLLEESGRYDHFELKSQYVKRRIYSVAEHCMVTIDIESNLELFHDQSEMRYATWFEMRGSRLFSRRQLLLLLCP